MTVCTLNLLLSSLKEGMASDKRKAIVLFWAVCLNFATASRSCVDLDVTGCRTNPQLCQDPILAEVTCPVMCNRCPTVPQTTPATMADDCSDVLKLGLSRGSGVYRIMPWNTHREVEVYCDMVTEGGGWTVFQRRWNGSVDFNRSFADYEGGFGSLEGEFWTGLGLLHTMTSRANMTLRVDVSLRDGTNGFDEYSGFYISQPQRYNFNVDRRINSRGMSGSYLLSETATRYSTNHQPFTTYDKDQDNWQIFNCAKAFGGGWWFNNCVGNNLNGPYTIYTQFFYKSFKVEGLKTSSMMFRLSN